MIGRNRTQAYGVLMNVFRKGLLVATFFGAFAAASLPAFAADEHGLDHGHEEADTAPHGREDLGFGGTGDLYQLVIKPQENGRTLVYLADYITNKPVRDAQVDVEVAGALPWQGQAKPGAEPGVYQLDWQPPPTGSVDVTAAITVGEVSDLVLVNGIAMHDEHGDEPATPAPAKTKGSLGTMTAIGAAIAALLAFVLVRRRRLLALLPVMFAVITAPGTVRAGEGHDHGEASLTASAAPGGTVRMAKGLQFLLDVRTEQVATKDVARSVRLVGRVMPDPSGFARLQPTQSGRVAFDPQHPLPAPGQRVERGQVVAIVEPNLSSVEKSDQRVNLLKVENEIAVTERQLARWAETPDLVPAKEVEAARLQLERLRKERQQLGGTALGRQVITSPISGVVTDVHVLPGESVDTDTVLIEVVNSSRMRVEAMLYDLGIAGQITGGKAYSRLVPNETFDLGFVGESPRVSDKDEGMHLTFNVKEPKGLLKVGMSVDVFAEVNERRTAIQIPRDAIAEVGGRTVAFVRTAPEAFHVRPVVVERYMGGKAEIRDGLKDGEIVAVQGVMQLKSAR